METHPDRARALGRPEVDLVREFRAVADAYRILSSLRAGPAPARRRRAPPPRPAERPRRAPRPPVAPRPGPSRPARPPPPRGPATRPARRACAPRSAPRTSRAAGSASPSTSTTPAACRWTELVEAIAWQRAQRPPIGRIAVDFGFLSPDDVGVILERRREAAANGVPFGEWAVRHGFLTSFQLLAVLGQQLRRQRPIGQFFVERGLLEPEEIDELRRRILRHNARWP